MGHTAEELEKPPAINLATQEQVKQMDQLPRIHDDYEVYGCGYCSADCFGWGDGDNYTTNTTIGMGFGAGAADSEANDKISSGSEIGMGWGTGEAWGSNDSYGVGLSAYSSDFM